MKIEKKEDGTGTHEEDVQMGTSLAKTDAFNTNDAKATQGSSSSMSAAKATVIAGAIMATAAVSVPFLDHLVPSWFSKEEQTLPDAEVTEASPESVVEQDISTNIDLDTVENDDARDSDNLPSRSEEPEHTDQTPDELATAAPIFRTTQVEFLNGARMQVCDEHWISAVPKFDSSSSAYSTTVITLPDGREMPFRSSGGEPVLIAPGCTIVGSRLREHRPNDPDAMLTIRQEIQ